MHQASILSNENNQIDDCLRGMLELLKVQSAQNLMNITEDLSNAHSKKVRSKIVHEEVEQVNTDGENQTFLKEDSESFLDIFEGCLKQKEGLPAYTIDENSSSSDTFMNVPEHLLQSAYLL